MSFLPYGPQSFRASYSAALACAARIVTISCAFLCMLWLGIRVYSAVTHAMTKPVGEEFEPGVELARQQNGPIVASVGGMKINIEAYNKKREKDIAVASGKLLTLAIALKAELNSDPAAEPSPTTMRKAKEIEKLAHDVKEMMKINMVGPY